MPALHQSLAIGALGHQLLENVSRRHTYEVHVAYEWRPRGSGVGQSEAEGHDERDVCDIHGQALGFVQQIQRRKAVVVVISDFLDDGPWDRVMGALCQRHKVHAIVVHDAMDEGLSGLGLMEVVDAETGRTQLVDARKWVAKKSLDERVRALRRLGAAASGLSTSDDAYTVLHQHFLRAGAGR